jgi:Bacterial aa3 type cytochrome c oxidase subunit IV
LVRDDGSPKSRDSVTSVQVTPAVSGCSAKAITLSPPLPGYAWRDGMADHAEVEYSTATGNDYPAHEQTYESFITLTKVMIAVIATIVILMAYFIG